MNADFQSNFHSDDAAGSRLSLPRIRVILPWPTLSPVRGASDFFEKNNNRIICRGMGRVVPHL